MASFSQVLMRTMAIRSCCEKFRSSNLKKKLLKSVQSSRTWRRKKNIFTRKWNCASKQCEKSESIWQRMQVNASTLQGQLSLLDRELREAEGKAKSLNWEQENVRQRLDAAIGMVDSLQQELSNSNRQLEALQVDLATAITRVDSLRRDEETLVDVLNELRVRVATERQRKENLQRQRQPMAVRLAELTDLIANRQRDIGNYTARIEQFANENSTLRARIEQFQTEQSTAEAEVGRILQERAERADALEAVELNLRHIRKQLTDCQEVRGQHEIKATQLNLRLEHIREHVVQRYHVDLTGIQPDWYAFQVCLGEQRKRLDRPTAEIEETQPSPTPSQSPEIDWDFVQTAIAEMTERLDAMGPVNLEAIQEYDELEERQKFLEDQHTDLVKSKNELLEVINKINATTKELFADTFEQVRMNFQEMFAELFAGGKANLLLVDDADPLESGIEIIARAARQTITIDLAIVRRGTDDDGRLASVRHLHGQAEPFLRARRNGCSTGRVKYPPVHQAPRPVRSPESVCRHNA